MKKKLFLVIPALACIYTASAQPCIPANTWLGITSDWLAPSNWCSGAIPTSTTDVIIPAGTPNQPVINAAGAACRTITISSGATLTINGNNTFSVFGDWVNNGTLNANNSTVSFTANTAITQTITGSTSFFSISKPNSNSTLSFGSSTTTIGNNLSVSGGSMSGGTSTITFTGNSASLQGSSTKDFYNLEISSGAVVTQTAGTTVNINNSYKNNGAFVQNNTRTITFQTNSQSLSGTGVSTFGNVTVSGAITLNAGVHDFSVLGIFNIPAASGTFNGGNATTIFSGVSAALGSGLGTFNFNNITISGALSNANNKNINVAGSWFNNGSYNAGSETVTFNGGLQTIGGTSSTVFSNINIAGTADKTLGNDIAVNNVLTLTSRNINADANSKTIYVKGTVARNTTGYIIGNLKKDIAAGTNVSKLFEVGTLDYSPLIIDFSTITTGGSLTVRTDNGDNPNIGISILDENKSVNRYWALTNSGIDAGSYDATFEFVASDMDAGVNANNFKVGKYSNGSWTYAGVVNVDATHIKATGLNGFSEFAIAEIACTSPSISGQPLASQDVCQNETSADLTVIASGDNLSYQWFVDNDNIGFDGNPVGANSNSFAPPTNMAGTSHYYCIVTGGCGTATSQYAKLAVSPLVTWYRDADGDGFGDASNSTQACTAPSAYVSNNDDCDDGDNSVYPGAMEICDGKDNDCNGAIDENIKTTFYRDADGDGFGDASNSTQTCVAPPNYVSNSADCNDDDPSAYPGAPETCDGKDNDCNGSVDDNTETITFYRDADGDGYGNSFGTTLQSCSTPEGYVSNHDDCDDDNAAVHPGAPEICDGKDNNCNGQIDESAPTTYYRDADGDGFGNPSLSLTACSKPSGYVSDNTDCNDNSSSVHPGAPEICGNGFDENCNGQVDEGCMTTVKVCTYSQAFYNNNSIVCLPNGILQAKQVMLNAVDAQPGDSVIFGLKTSGRFFTLKKSDIQNGYIFKLLPGSGASKALKAYATFTKSATWSNVPLNPAGVIQNELLAQTMTLFFNLQLSSQLASLPLNANLSIRKLTLCMLQGNLASIKFGAKPEVASCLQLKFGNQGITIGNLYKLANELLGNANSCNLNYGDVNDAVKTVNEFFNGCVMVNIPGFANNIQSITVIPSEKNPEAEAMNEERELKVTTSPNPFRTSIRFNIVSPETGKVKILIYDASGVKRGELEQDVVRNIPSIIWFRNEQLRQGLLFYRVLINNRIATGKIMQVN